MAGRPPKRSVDQSVWEVDIFGSPKIDRLMSAQGCAGFVVYFYLCQKAYGSNGYYCSWSCAESSSVAKQIGGGVGAKTVEETVRYCLHIGLFDKGLYDGWKILSSREIQKRYAKAALTRKHKTVIKDYWLLSPEESAGLDFCTVNPNYDPQKLNLSPSKLNYDPSKLNLSPSKLKEKESDKEKEEKERTKEREEKEITKEKERLRGKKETDKEKSPAKPFSEAVSETPDEGQQKKPAKPYKEIVDYLNAKTNKNFRHGIRATQAHINARLAEGFTLDDFRKVIDIKVRDWKNDPKMKKYLRPETLFCTKFGSYRQEWEDGTDESYGDGNTGKSLFNGKNYDTVI